MRTASPASAARRTGARAEMRAGASVDVADATERTFDASKGGRPAVPVEDAPANSNAYPNSATCGPRAAVDGRATVLVPGSPGTSSTPLLVRSSKAGLTACPQTG